jgi:hypothetical protein
MEVYFFLVFGTMEPFFDHDLADGLTTDGDLLAFRQLLCQQGGSKSFVL